MSKHWKPAVAALLACAILVQGCAGASIKHLQEQCDLVHPGATHDDVVRDLGQPAKVYTVPADSGAPDQTVEVWSYTFELSHGANAGVVIACVVVIVLLLALVLASGGRGAGGGNFGGGGLGGGSEVWRFCIGFDAEGHVRGVSCLERIR